MVDSHINRHMGLDFVDRQRETAELTAAPKNSLSGRGRLVMLVGEPGIGKMRNAKALALTMAAPRPREMRIRTSVAVNLGWRQLGKIPCFCCRRNAVGVDRSATAVQFQTVDPTKIGGENM